MAKASDFKKGMVLEINGAPHVVRQVEARSPSSRGAATLYKVRLNNLLTKQKLDLSLKGDDSYPNADTERVEVQFSYTDGDEYFFMRLDDFSQYGIQQQDISDELGYITEGLEGLVALLVNGNLAAIELPASVALEIVETSPGIKGASASARTKPATLTTGLEVQVPEYLEPGEIIKVNTTTGKYMSRA